jgi:hypothetical protein
VLETAARPILTDLQDWAIGPDCFSIALTIYWLPSRKTGLGLYTNPLENLSL